MRRFLLFAAVFSVVLLQEVNYNLFWGLGQ